MKVEVGKVEGVHSLISTNDFGGEINDGDKCINSYSPQARFVMTERRGINLSVVEAELANLDWRIVPQVYTSMSELCSKSGPNIISNHTKPQRVGGHVEETERKETEKKGQVSGGSYGRF